MPTLGVKVALIEAGQILMIKREDFGVWVLPGGGVEPGESIAQAAIREAYEETGLEVELTRLVGLYSRPLWPIGDGSGDHTILFAAKMIGGTLRPQPEEVLEAAFFAPDNLPSPMFWWHHQPIRDAVDGVGGSSVWLQNIVLPLNQSMTHLTRQELYELRDKGELPLEQLFSLCRLPKPGEEDLEVGR